jgi:hypothetical protein
LNAGQPLGPVGSTEVFRGRLRQALTGGVWVFNTSTGQNGVLGFTLGGIDGTWSSSESPAAGLQVTITRPLLPASALPAPTTFNEVIVLTTLIPAVFAD